MTQDETSGATPGTTDFGYRRVGEHEKAGLVRGVFDALPGATTS